MHKFTFNALLLRCEVLPAQASLSQMLHTHQPHMPLRKLHFTFIIIIKQTQKAILPKLTPLEPQMLFCTLSFSNINLCFDEYNGSSQNYVKYIANEASDSIQRRIIPKKKKQDKVPNQHGYCCCGCFIYLFIIHSSPLYSTDHQARMFDHELLPYAWIHLCEKLSRIN